MTDQKVTDRVQTAVDDNLELEWLSGVVSNHRSTGISKDSMLFGWQMPTATPPGYWRPHPRKPRAKRNKGAAYE